MGNNAQYLAKPCQAILLHKIAGCQQPLPSSYSISSGLHCSPAHPAVSPVFPPFFLQTESFSLGATPTTREAQAIADEIFADFVSAEADKVELVYTKFVSLINSVPTVQTLLPLTPTGELCDLEGNCVDAADDEIFKLTTQVRELNGEMT